MQNSADDATGSATPPRYYQRPAVSQQVADRLDRLDKKRKALDERKNLRGKLSPPSKNPALSLAALMGFVPRPDKIEKTKNEAPITVPHVQEITLSNARFDENIMPSIEEVDTTDEDGDRERRIEEAGHVDRDASKEGSGEGKKARPGNPSRSGIRKSRQASDFDSLFDVSTSGAGSHSEVNAGDEGVKAGDEGVKAGDEGVKAGDEVVRAGDEGVDPRNKDLECW